MEKGKGILVQMAEERLQKIIAAAGVASRRKAEELIVAGEVTVNGRLVTELGARADPKNRPLVIDLLGPYRNKVHPVGRLDFNTEGLLLLTNDGDFTNLIAGS